MDLRRRSTQHRAAVCRVTLAVCPVLILLGACGAPSAEETSATPQVGTSASTSSAPTAPRTAQPSSATSRPEAPGSPLRIPLPVDELIGRPLLDAEPEMEGLIAEACGGGQCIDLRIEHRDDLNPDEGIGCADHVFSVPGTVTEEVDEGWALPVLYVPRGGTITLVVERSCDESQESPSPREPSPTDTSPTPEVDGGDQRAPSRNPSANSGPRTP